MNLRKLAIITLLLGLGITANTEAIVFGLPQMTPEFARKFHEFQKTKLGSKVMNRQDVLTFLKENIQLDQNNRIKDQDSNNVWSVFGLGLDISQSHAEIALGKNPFSEQPIEGMPKTQKEWEKDQITMAESGLPIAQGAMDFVKSTAHTPLITAGGMQYFYDITDKLVKMVKQNLAQKKTQPKPIQPKKIVAKQRIK